MVSHGLVSLLSGSSRVCTLWGSQGMPLVHTQISSDRMTAPVRLSAREYLFFSFWEATVRFVQQRWWVLILLPSNSSYWEKWGKALITFFFFFYYPSCEIIAVFLHFILFVKEKKNVTEFISQRWNIKHYSSNQQQVAEFAVFREQEVPDSLIVCSFVFIFCSQKRATLKAWYSVDVSSWPTSAIGAEGTQVVFHIRKLKMNLEECHPFIY